MLKLSRRQVDHEDVVAEAYAALRRAALYLTRGDEAEAGDLLHDTFVRFLLLRPPLDAIGNLDGYLYTMLRNVYLSRQRRHVRRKALVVETIDVDLLAVMVEEPEPDERLRMRDDLMRLVDHARERTRVTRAASAWILRCVHGYYPAEIARLMKMPPRAVDRALHVAKREALEELRRPTRRRRDRDGGAGVAGQRWRGLHVGLHGSHDGTDGTGGPEGEEPLDTLQALRVRLFASVYGACLTNDEVAGLYRNSPCAGDDANADAVEPAGTLLMAHVVACAGCLDRINHHLDLPPLKTRDPVESSGTRRPRGGESGGPGGAGGAGDPGRPDGPAGAGRVGPHGEAKGGSASRGGAGLEPLLRRTRDTIASIVDHVPRELRIAANGLELGALPVAGVVTVQELAVRLAESLAFVEIFDERGALVCYWPAQVPREGMLDDDITIELPDGRSIELRVSLMDDCPRLRVRYTDERLNAAARVSANAGLRVGVGIGSETGVNVNVADISDIGNAAAGAGLRKVRRSPRQAIVEAARHLQWWRRLVPSPRMAIVAGVLVMLWMILIGPTTTWAALGHLGRAAVAVIRTLITSQPPATQPAATPPAPATPPAATASPSAIEPPRAATPARVFSPSELSDLEMAVRVALHDVHADLGEDITLRATPAGVAVQGVVDAASRRDSIARALADLDGASVNVRTADEVSALPRASGTRDPRATPATPGARATSATRATGGTRGLGKNNDGESSRALEAVGLTGAVGPIAAVGAGESPAFANTLQEALAARMPAPADRAAFVNETLARADEALARAWALRRLAERYPSRDVTSLSPLSSQALATLVDDHTAALRTAVDVLITRVTPLVAAAEVIDHQRAGAATRDDAIDARDAIGAKDVSGANETSTASDASNAQRSTMQIFTLVNAWHADAHALLAGVRVVALPTTTNATPSADRPDTLRPAAREWLIRLHRIQDALKR